MDKYLKILFDELNNAIKNDEVPISALIVCKDKVIAKASNQRQDTNNVLGHAEIIVIQEAANKLNDWRLNDCDLYVTLKPCSMCEEIIKQSRIRNVYYLIEKPSRKLEYNKTIFIKMDYKNYEEEYQHILSDFFEIKRQKDK